MAVWTKVPLPFPSGIKKKTNLGGNIIPFYLEILIEFLFGSHFIVLLNFDTSNNNRMTNNKNSQDKSMSKLMLSQPAPGCSHYQKLLWLQKRRGLGLWVQCDDCNRWRYLPNILDKHQLSKKWSCSMNPDETKVSCSVPEEPIHFNDEEDLIHSEYSAGSLVIARLSGWPWWPAMVDDCPDTEQYYWLDGFSDIPTHYNVVFFDTHDVTRAWIAPEQLKPYADGQDLLKKSLDNKTYQKRIKKAMEQADDAEILPVVERLAKYSFITKYRGNILSPKKINRKEAKKYQENFKRKYNIDLPFETDSDEDIPLKKSVKKRSASNKKSTPMNNKPSLQDKEKSEEPITKTDEADKILPTDGNNNLEATKDYYNNSSQEILSQDHRMPTPPSDDFDFKMI